MQKEGLSQENSDYDLSKLSDENKENNSEETERKNSISFVENCDKTNCCM